MCKDTVQCGQQHFLGRKVLNSVREEKTKNKQEKIHCSFSLLLTMKDVMLQVLSSLLLIMDWNMAL